MDPRVEAIRNNQKVGRGSCSSIDECCTDDDLVQSLDFENIGTPEEAVKWALEEEGLFLEQGLNARWGEDDDPQLKAYKKFHEEDG